MNVEIPESCLIKTGHNLRANSFLPSEAGKNTMIDAHQQEASRCYQLAPLVVNLIGPR